MYKRQSEILKLKKQLEYQSTISSLFREIECQLIEVDNQLTQLKEALDVTSAGYLSAILIPPNKLNKLLKEIATKLPVGLSLIIKSELDMIYHYYRVAKVHAIATRNVIRVIIDIPLQSKLKSTQNQVDNLKLLLQRMYIWVTAYID